MSRLSTVAAVLLAAVLAACASITPIDVTPEPSAADPMPTPVPTEAAGRDMGPERIIGSARLDRPSQPAMAAAYRADLVADPCFDRDLPAPPSVDPAMVVLDRSYAIPAPYAPPDLVTASAAGLSGTSGTKLVREIIVEDLAAMASAWEEAGLSIAIESAYRTYANQAATFNSWVAQIGYVDALSRSARPGHSEHQLGTALDLTSPGWSGRFGDWAIESAEGAWMAAHGWEYGFVMSYPAGSQEATCFTYEPWHYRWIGRDDAAAHRESGYDLRRYLERYVDA